MTTIDPRELLNSIARLENTASEVENSIAAAQNAANQALEQARNAMAQVTQSEEAIGRMQGSLRSTLELIDEMKTAANQIANQME